MKTADQAFDAWYAMQRHQLSNEPVCRVIYKAAWEKAHEVIQANPQDHVRCRAEIAKPASFDRYDFLKRPLLAKAASSPATDRP